MKRFTLCLCMLAVVGSVPAGMAQYPINAMGTTYTINFTGFAGAGYTPSPGAGQLDSDEWLPRGLSDNLNPPWGFTATTGDFARGMSAGGVITGGIYAFDTGGGNIILGVQPSGADFTPGSHTLRLLNNTPSTIASINLSYSIWVYNDQGYGSYLNYYHGPDDVNYTHEPSLDYSTPVAPDAPPYWFQVVFSITLSGLNIPGGSYYYFQWQSDDAGGGGSRDEFGLDDIQFTAFAQEEGLDFGDAPDSIPSPQYPTLLANNGARHTIVPNLYLGLTVDGEPDGQPDPNAMGDDNDTFYPPANDDEDGVVFTTPLNPGLQATVAVTAGPLPGFLSAWIDFNANTIWQGDPGEQIFLDQPAVPGLNMLNFMVPATAVIGPTFARFRFYSTPGNSMCNTDHNPCPDGEVEDYLVYIEEETVDYDFGDAPDQSVGASYFYPVVLANTGARHAIAPGVFLGGLIDAEPDGLPSLNADGDDLSNLADEDGLAVMTQLLTGQQAQIDVTASVGGYVSVWIDFSADGDWGDAGEQVFSDTGVVAGLNSLFFTVPAGAVPGNTYLRIRFYTSAGFPCNTDSGLCPDGEVEDYQVLIEEEILELDFGDAPDALVGPTFFYPTTLVVHMDPARHTITIPPMYIGPDPMDIDSEPDGQPDPLAMGDDNDIYYPPANDDEDGAAFLPPLTAGGTGLLQVQVGAACPMAGYISAWVDFNADGDWGDANEQIVADNGPHPPGAIVALPFSIPIGSAWGQTFARVRFYSQPGLPQCNQDHGPCPDGEVEDHEIMIDPPEPPTLVINEIDYDQNSTDDREFVEIYNYGPSGVDLSLYDLVFVNGNLTPPGIYDTIQLASTTLAANDYWVVCTNPGLVANCDQVDSPLTNWIQNADTSPPFTNGDAVALVWRGSTNIIDTVAYVYPVTGWTEGPGNAPADPPSIPPPDYSINRCPDGDDTNDNAADFEVWSISPGLTNNCVPPTDTPLPATETPTAAPATETPTIAPPTETPTPGGPTSTPAPIPATGPAGLGLLLLGLGALLGTHSIRRR